MEHCQDLEIENYELIDRVTEIQNENQRLHQENATLQKALEKQKKFHRKFSDDVVESEQIRYQDFKSEKRSLIAENQVLVKENRQLSIDFKFYKKAYEEVSNEDKSIHTKHLSQRSDVDEGLATEPPAVQPGHTIRQTQRSEVDEEVSTETRAVLPAPTKRQTRSANLSTSTLTFACNHKSSRELTKVSEKLFTENKKLKVKNNALSATILILKKKNRSLEIDQQKMVNKKERYFQAAGELEWLAESSKIKNSDMFTPEVLFKISQFSK